MTIEKYIDQSTEKILKRMNQIEEEMNQINNPKSDKYQELSKERGSLDQSLERLENLEKQFGDKAKEFIIV